MVEVEAHDSGSPRQHAKAMSALSAACVEDEIACADVKPLEIDGE